QHGQGWAEKLAEKGFLQYSENPGLGENISLVDLDQPSKKGEQIVKEWYKEINNYNYSKPGWKRGAYHVRSCYGRAQQKSRSWCCHSRTKKTRRRQLQRPAGNNNTCQVNLRRNAAPTEESNPGQ
ncbi:golgi-associated plant pathogenesis-related protein 1, partial [Trichonephila inaurata madagascariensis]